VAPSGELTCVWHQISKVWPNIWFGLRYALVFTARRYAQARYLLWPGICPSVRPSVCHVHVLYPDGWRYRQTFKLLSHPGRPTPP